jgi:hypothetical protein
MQPLAHARNAHVQLVKRRHLLLGAAAQLGEQLGPIHQHSLGSKRLWGNNAVARGTWLGLALNKS